MKKIFTLISMALVAMSVNAQSAEEKFVAVDADGNIAAEFTNAVLADGKLTATITTTSTTAVAVAGANPKTVEGSGAQYINPDGTVTEWDTPEFKGPSSHNDTGFKWIQGSGNPYVGISAEEIVTEGEGTGTYRAVYDYYAPDGSKGLPLTGFYVEFSATVAGTFKIQFWNNKGNTRELYIADAETAKALTPNTEYKAYGYVNGQKNEDGTMKLFDPYTIGTADAPYLIEPDFANGQVRLGWLQFDAQAGKKYLVFGKDWQFGFAGYEFTPSGETPGETPGDDTAVSTVKTAAENADAPIYNLAGQKVDKSFKGIVIQNGKKVVIK